MRILCRYLIKYMSDALPYLGADPYTFGIVMTIWASHDALQTAVLLDDADTSGSLEIQVDVAFSVPQ
jgi:hypothetical protein